MTHTVKHQREAEQLGLRVRWISLATMALLGTPLLSQPWFVAAILIFAATNVAAHQLCGAGRYNQWGRPFMAGVRVVDALWLTFLSFHGPFVTDNLWLLLIPTILSEGLVQRDLRRIGALAAISSALPIAALIMRGWDLRAASSVGLMVVAALASFVLASYREREQTLTARDGRLDAVLECATALAASSDLRALMLHTLRTACDELNASHGYVMLVSTEDRNVLATEAAYSVNGSFDFTDRLEVGSGVTGYAVKMGQPISIHRRESEQFDLEGIPEGARSVISVPLVARNYMGPAQARGELVLGAITLIAGSEDCFADSKDTQLLRSLCALIAEAVANARMEERQRTTFLQTLETLAKSLEARDMYTQGHSQRVCEVSQMIGERMGLSAEALEELRVGTILHDIGKIGVPDSILNKPGRLTDEEFDTMKRHPVMGYEICRPLGLSEGVLMIVRNHHEKLDGSGYPDGLKGGELPLSLRIVCVADAFDAMSSRRPYRDVMDMGRVLAELSTGAGIQFDPVVVEVLKDLLPSERMRDCYANQWEEKAA